MKTLPGLPSGFHAQPVWHRDIDDFCYEFHRVYDPRGRLDTERSYWLKTPLAEGDRPSVEAVSYAQLRALRGGRALPFLAFASQVVPPSLINEWLRELDAQTAGALAQS